jgi:hypothetical protein
MVTNNFENRNCMQPMGKLSMHSKCLDFSSFKLEGGGGGGERIFFSYAQHVPFQVPNGFPSVPQLCHGI